MLQQCKYLIFQCDPIKFVLFCDTQAQYFKPISGKGAQKLPKNDQTTQQTDQRDKREKYVQLSNNFEYQCIETEEGPQTPQCPQKNTTVK